MSNAPPAPTSEEPLFYVLSLRHSKSSDGVLLFWGPNDADYRYRLNQCGKYTEAQIQAPGNYYDNGDSTRAIPVADVLAIAERAGDVRGEGMDWFRDPDDLVVAFTHFKRLARRASTWEERLAEGRLARGRTRS